jgi:threonylcarbamoyladenosine tRNA methylthiotransferase MtaB
MATFYIEQFGCRATQADGAALERQLLQRGYIPGPEDTADIVVINTCTVTAAADAQARDAIRKIGAKNRSARMIVTGCYAQRAPEELASLPGVSWVVGNSHKPELPHIIENLSSASESARFVPAASLQWSSLIGPQPQAQILTGEFERKPLLSAPVFGGEANHTRPTLKIQDGCNSRCSYCVIPFVRGKSRSLPPEMVVAEINQLTASGIREIVLSGINIGTYGRDLHPRVTFKDLLRRILDETSIERVRVSSIEPMDVTRDLVELFAEERLAQHFHLPLQSGTDRILASMHRWYRAEQYARRVQIIRELLPQAAIGADVIAGFPGESDEEHLATLAFIESLPLTYLHAFSFSKRPGTAAAKLSEEIPARIVKNRARELRELGERKSATFRREQVGAKFRVLTLRSNHDDDPRAGELSAAGQPAVRSAEYTPALSSNYLRFRVPGMWPANQWLDVRAVSGEGNYLVGKPEISSKPDKPVCVNTAC